MTKSLLLGSTVAIYLSSNSEHAIPLLLLFLELRRLYLCCLGSGSKFPSLFVSLDKSVPV